MARKQSQATAKGTRTTPRRGSARRKVEVIDTETLTRSAYERLEDMIVTLQIPPGTMVSEARLAEVLGIGRTPVREALQRLAREELVEIHASRGILVTPLNVIRQLQLLDVRRALEQLLSERACEHAMPEERERMLQLAEEIQKAAASGDGYAFLKVNRETHLLKARAAHNEILTHVMDLFHGLSRRFWFAHYQRQEGSLVEAAAVHARHLRAIALSDVKQACEAADRLIDFLERFTRQTIELKRVA